MSDHFPSNGPVGPKPQEPSVETARFHILKAHDVLSAVMKANDRMEQRHQDDTLRVKDAHSGTSAAFNDSQKFNLDVALTHAITGIALFLAAKDPFFVFQPSAKGGDA